MLDATGTSSASHREGAPHAMLGPIVLFGSACFFVFGVIYLALLHSPYMFLSNTAFGCLCSMTWFIRPRRATHEIRATLFLALVYLGLVNVAVHIGDTRSPMVFWGISVAIAAVFLYKLPGQLAWFGLVLAFFPVVQILKSGVCSNRTIPLNAWQVQVLSLATYVGLLTFLTYCFIIFRRRLDEALAKVKTLSGLLPICAACKKVRDDDGYWRQIESYLKSHTSAEFTHGLCPDCVESLYPGYQKERPPHP